MSDFVFIARDMRVVEWDERVAIASSQAPNLSIENVAACVGSCTLIVSKCEAEFAQIHQVRRQEIHLTFFAPHKMPLKPFINFR